MYLISIFQSDWSPPYLASKSNEYLSRDQITNYSTRTKIEDTQIFDPSAWYETSAAPYQFQLLQKLDWKIYETYVSPIFAALIFADWDIPTLCMK